jgi:hypothetical protein
MKVIIMFFTVELDVGDAVLQLALLVDHVLQAAGGVFQRALVDRAGDQVLHGGDLAAQPAVVVQQLADVLEQQLEQAQQQLLLFGRCRRSSVRSGSTVPSGARRFRAAPPRRARVLTAAPSDSASAASGHRPAAARRPQSSGCG